MEGRFIAQDTTNIESINIELFFIEQKKRKRDKNYNIASYSSTILVEQFQDYKNPRLVLNYNASLSTFYFLNPMKNMSGYIAQNSKRLKNANVCISLVVENHDLVRVDAVIIYI